jgi:predicted anti-sigma-YlaC factor YlaD
MDCNELESYLEKGVQEMMPKEMQQHLTECASCRSLFNIEVKLNQFINQRKNISVPNEFNSQVLNKIAAPSIKKLPLPFYHNSSRMAAAIALLILSVSVGILAGRFSSNIYSSNAFSDYENISTDLSYGLIDNSFDLTNIEE